MKTKWAWIWTGLALLSLTAAMLLGCGASSVVPTRMLVTADMMNNRVLVYNAPFSTNQAASFVLGQPDFAHATPKFAADSMALPTAAAVDGNGNIYVAQQGACRVTRFTPPLSNGMSASLVLGEPDFTTVNCAISATGLSLPYDLAFDANGNLWVSDAGSNRLVQFSPPFTNGMAAGIVIGQTDFTTGACNQGAGMAGPATARTVCFPTGMTFDGQGNLWVADQDNSRVLQFRPPFTNGMAASLVLGQADFAGNLCNRNSDMSAPAAANTICNAFGLGFDGQGNLWLADYANSRVLQYRPPFTSGMAASLVLGQTNFSDWSAGPPLTSSTMSLPMGLAFDSSGKLFVADAYASRTLIYAPPFSNGMAASIVIGQADFSSFSFNQGLLTPAANTLCLPTSVATW